MGINNIILTKKIFFHASIVENKISRSSYVIESKSLDMSNVYCYGENRTKKNNG
jgi:hypothetical protein